MKRAAQAFGKALSLAAFLGIFLALPVFAKFTPPPAPVNGYIYDETSTLSSDQIKDLNQLIDSYKKRNSGKIELGVYIAKSLGDTEIAEAGLQTARAWGIGDAKRKNGVLLLVAMDMHKIRIEVGTGVEGSLTDLSSSHIIRQIIAPEFKENDFYSGIKKGIMAISAAVTTNLSAEEKALLSQAEQKDDDLIITLLYIGGIILFVILIIFLSTKMNVQPDLSGKSSSSRRFPPHIGSSGGSSNSSSGGFSGGGSFSGGGASGSW